MVDITGILFAAQDPAYRDFQARLIPNISKDTIIGVRTPDLRRIAKGLEEKDEFLHQLPHRYFEENQVHAFILERCRDYEKTIALVEDFLPYVDNWATCDQLSPKVFRKHREDLLTHIPAWLRSEHTYAVRFGIGMLMSHYLDEDFSPEYLNWVASVRREEYYIRMMAAWYFATALAKQYDSAIPYLTQHRLEPWVHNKTIQKAVESFRITDEQKTYLKTLRISNK